MEIDPTMQRSEVPAVPTTTVPTAPSTTTLIRPEPSTHGKVIKLGPIDQIAPRDYISVCLFLRLAPGTDIHRIYKLFQLAMLRTINDIPELASCVQHCTDNSREEVELLFDAEKGAEVHFKDYTSPELQSHWIYGSFDELEREHFPLSRLPRHIVYGTSKKLTENARLPCLVTQANFIPGGLIIGSCLHTKHVAGDGVANFLWHKHMGEHFAALADGLLTKPVAPADFSERTGQVQGETGMRLEEFPNWKLAGDNFLNPTKYSAADIPKFEYATYFVSEDKLQQLKKRMAAGCPETKLFMVDAIGAFLWRHVIVARDIDAKKYPEAKLSITVDARGRMEGPRVSNNYWGNFAEPNAVARLPLSVLQRTSTNDLWEKTYSEAARRIHGAIGAVDNKAVRRLVGLLNQMPKSTTLTWNVDRWPGPDMLIVCVQGHRFNDIYFGSEIGYPACMRCTVGDTEGKPDGRCIIYPSRRTDGRGLEVSLQYDCDTLNRLETNTEFREFFERRN